MNPPNDRFIFFDYRRPLLTTVNLSAFPRACKFARMVFPHAATLAKSALLSSKFPSIAARTVIPQCKFFPQFALFDRAINLLPMSCRPRMTAREKFNSAAHYEAAARRRIVLSLPHINKGGTKWTFP
jgi:hypothetical protein